MKQLQSAVFFVLLSIFFGCEDKSESPKMSVERYVEQLKAGKYDNMELPDFSSEDIPKLLSYRNETELITGFPINYISSSLTQECALGMYVLWTVESIRARSIGSEFLVGTFPSQNPVVKNREDFEYIEQNQQVLKEVADSYFEWWESNKIQDFSEFHQIDPLGTTAYRWH